MVAVIEKPIVARTARAKGLGRLSEAQRKEIYDTNRAGWSYGHTCTLLHGALIMSIS